LDVAADFSIKADFSTAINAIELLKFIRRYRTNWAAGSDLKFMPWMVSTSNLLEILSMRPSIAFLSCFFLLATSSVQAQQDEPLMGGSPASRSARFEESDSHLFRVARARAESNHRDTMLRQYDWMGFDYGRPTVNAGMYSMSANAFRRGRYFGIPGAFNDLRNFAY
jgi:hypothetical protein